jgi:xylulokinase
VQLPEVAEYVAIGAARQAAWALTSSAEPPSWQGNTKARLELDEPTEAQRAEGHRIQQRHLEAREAAYGVRRTFGED